MGKGTLFTLIAWIVLAILNILDLFIGLNIFFYICHICFAALNGIVIIALIPTIIQGIKDRRK